MTTKKIIYSILLFVTATAMISLILAYVKGETPMIGQKMHEMRYGVVDPENAFEKVEGVSIEHSYIAWKRDDVADFNMELDKSIKLKREPLVTIEPWSFTQKGDTLFKDIVSGDYKSTIQSLCKSADSKNTPVILRWGHEMDYAGSSRYPWANKDYGGFVNAYKYWVSTCKEVAKNNKIRFMWSPGGKDGLEKYYPGDNFVDMVGLSLYGYPEYEQKTLGYKQSFREVMDEKYNRVKQFDKPVYLSEMGVAGTSEYKKQWIEGMYKETKSQQKYPLLYGFVWFQYADKNPWVEGIVAPDFRIDTKLFPPTK